MQRRETVKVAGLPFGRENEREVEVLVVSVDSGLEVEEDEGEVCSVEDVREARNGSLISCRCACLRFPVWHG